VCIKHHQTNDERISAAQKFVDDYKFPIETVVDTMANEANRRYDAWPERLYVIVDGVVVYKGGPGPFDYRLDECLGWLDLKFKSCSS
jgi:type I thyroxine 5'-deiodinase